MNIFLYDKKMQTHEWNKTSDSTQRGTQLKMECVCVEQKRDEKNCLMGRVNT